MRTPRAALLATLAFTMSGCIPDLMTDIGPEPSPTPVATAPTPAPTPVAAPQPVATPVPEAPAPTPAPEAPAPTPEPPAARSCRLEPMPDHGNCPRTSPVFQADVEAALDEVIDLYPQIFDMRDVRDCSGYRCPLVVNGPAFERRMVERLELKGYCAKCDEECGVKDSNRFNEQYDVMIADGHLRRGDGSYRATCWPAAF